MSPAPRTLYQKIWDDHVVHQFPVVRPDFRGLDPLVFGEVCRNDGILVFHYPVGGNRVILTHLENSIWFAELPSLGELRRLGQVFRVALWCAGGNPLGDRGLIGVAHEERQPVHLESQHPLQVRRRGKWQDDVTFQQQAGRHVQHGGPALRDRNAVHGALQAGIVQPVATQWDVGTLTA